MASYTSRAGHCSMKASSQAAFGELSICCCRAGVEFARNEVQFENLSIEADVYVGNRAMPTIPNSFRNLAEVIIFVVHRIVSYRIVSHRIPVIVIIVREWVMGASRAWLGQLPSHDADAMHVLECALKHYSFDVRNYSCEPLLI